MGALLTLPDAVEFDRPGKTHYQVMFPLDGAWGYTLVPLTVINGRRGENPNGIACFGGTHGNEYEGQIAVARLAQELDPETMTGRVILMPRLSESACVANTRVSPLDGVNMNRAFPGNARGTVSSRIADFVTRRVFPLVRVVIDVHSGGREGMFPMCSSFHPIPDPAQYAEIAAVARLFDTPFQFIYASTMASGLLTDQAEAMGKIAIGGEFGSGESASPIGIRHAYIGMRNVMRHYGIEPGPIEPVREAGAPPSRLVKADQLDAYVPAPRDGVWEPVAGLGSFVRAGERIGRLHDFSDHSEAPLDILAARDGFVIMMHQSARPLRGQMLYVLAEEVSGETGRE